MNHVRYGCLLRPIGALTGTLSEVHHVFLHRHGSGGCFSYPCTSRLLAGSQSSQTDGCSMFSSEVVRHSDGADVFIFFRFASDGPLARTRVSTAFTVSCRTLMQPCYISSAATTTCAPCGCLPILLRLLRLRSIHHITAKLC